MNESQHTPGPWKIVNHGEKICAIRTAEGANTYVCELPYETLQQQANARLIAVAPKLLSMLYTLERMSRGIDWCDSEEQARRWNEARTTIASVIGNQPVLPAVIKDGEAFPSGAVAAQLESRDVRTPS